MKNWLFVSIKVVEIITNRKKYLLFSIQQLFCWSADCTFCVYIFCAFIYSFVVYSSLFQILIKLICDTLLCFSKTKIDEKNYTFLHFCFYLLFIDKQQIREDSLFVAYKFRRKHFFKQNNDRKNHFQTLQGKIVRFFLLHFKMIFDQMITRAKIYNFTVYGHFCARQTLLNCYLLLTHPFPRSYSVVSGVLFGQQTVLKTGFITRCTNISAKYRIAKDIKQQTFFFFSCLVFFLSIIWTTLPQNGYG